MAVLSVQICVGLKVLKNWGLHPVDELATLADVLEQFSQQQMDGCSSFAFPEDLRGQPFDCFVGSTSSGPFQTTFLSAKVGDMLSFGKHLKFVIRPKEEAVMATGTARDAFQVMRNVQLAKHVPKKMTERTNRDKLKNKFIDFLNEEGVGWSADCVETTGKKFVGVMTDILWYLDGHEKTLMDRGITVPSLFAGFSGFNKPESHGHKRIPMEATKLRTFSQNLFSISEEPWLSRSIWSSINDTIKDLASNLSSYCDYLDHQRKRSNDRHLSPVLIRASPEAEKFTILSPHLPVKLAYVERYKALNSILKEESCFSPVFLNPQEVRKRKGIDVHAVMSIHAYGNNLGTLHFIWRVPDGISQSELLDQNLKTAQTVQEKIGVYHTRAMQKAATHSFGRICGIKPAYLREIYKRLTGDASASRTSDEAEVDVRIRLLLDSEDSSIVCDLRELNKGQPEEYSLFWDECKRHLESVVEVCVHERRHGDVTYLASALSARDLLTEVAKKCPEGTPTPSEAWLRYQFWPKDPSKRSASQYTGRLKVKHMVQARQLRKFHDDAHYASALYRYLRSFSVKYSSVCTFASLDDKHHCKVGEPNHPVAAVERGKSVLVSLKKSFFVSDHDFTRFSLIPSVVLVVDIPNSPDESFLRGQVLVGLKDLALEPSSALRHATEFSKVCAKLMSGTCSVAGY